MERILFERMRELKNDGLSYSKIAKELNIPLGTVKTYFNRNKDLIVSDKRYCLNCHKEIVSIPHHKERKFCSDKCRLEWWGKNRDKLKLKTLETITCRFCNREFTAPRHAKRIYCSRGCFNKSKVGGCNG